MNKLFTKVVGLCLGLTMAVGVGTAVAFNGVHKEAVEAKAGDTVTKTFGLSSNPGGWPTANSTTLTNYTYTLDGTDYTFGLKNVKCNSGYLMLTSTAVLGLPAIDGYKLTKVVASNSSGCSTTTKVGISSSSSSASYISGGAIQTWSTQSSSYTYNLTGTDANTVYYIYVTNKNAQIISIELTYENSGSSKTLDHISVGGAMTKTEYNTAESWDPAGLTVTAHYDDSSSATVTESASWSFSPAAPAEGVTSVTATATYQGKTADSAAQAVTVTEYVADVYMKVTSAPADWSGNYLLVYESNASTAYVWTGVDAVGCYLTATISNNKIEKPFGASSVEFAPMTGGYSIEVLDGENAEKYITYAKNDNGMSFGTSKTVMTPSYNSESSSTFIANAGGAIMRYNKTSGQDRFRYYKTTSYGSQQPVQLYKKVEAYTIANFVSDWNTATNAACSNPDADNTTAIKNAWSGIKANYLKLSEADQAKVAAGEDPTPASLIERYDHIVARYALENFMNRSVTPSPRINVLSTMNDNGSIAIIVIVSLLSVTAIGGYFFIRRRKEN